MFGSPLGTYLHPKGWVRPAGNNEPVVTATFADHIAGNRNPGVDIGTARCNDPLYAMEAGTVSLSGLIGTAQVVRIKHANGDESGYAHLSSRAVVKDQAVKRGQLIGTLGMSGATACHLHLGLKRNGAEIDAYPLIGDDDMTPIPTAAFKALNKKTSLLVGANFRSERQIDPGNVIKQYPTSTAFAPSVSANDGAPAGGATPTLWYGGFLYSDIAPQGFRFGWFHSSVLGPLVDVAPPADCGPQVKAATDPLNKKIAAAKTALA